MHRRLNRLVSGALLLGLFGCNFMQGNDGQHVIVSTDQPGSWRAMYLATAHVATPFDQDIFAQTKDRIESDEINFDATVRLMQEHGRGSLLVLASSPAAGVSGPVPARIRALLEAAPHNVTVAKTMELLGHPGDVFIITVAADPGAGATLWVGGHDTYLTLETPISLALTTDVIPSLQIKFSKGGTCPFSRFHHTLSPADPLDVTFTCARADLH